MQKKKKFCYLMMAFKSKVKKPNGSPKPDRKRGKKGQGTLKSKTPAIVTDIVMLQKNTGEFEYIAAPMNVVGDDLLSLSTVVQAKVIQEYGNETRPLNIVAVTDGAKVICNRLLTIFGVAVVVILDWYHLSKKLRQLMSIDYCK